MTPFGSAMREARLRANLRQADLADLLGYEQTYVSALELGTKGPPPPEFVDRMATALSLSDEVRDQLLDALDNSQRNVTLGVDASEALFEVFNEFRRQLTMLHPEQIRLIGAVLELRSALGQERSTGTPRLKTTRGNAPRRAGEAS